MRVLAMLALVAAMSNMTHAPERRVRDRWQFKFHKFVIGAWWGPDATDAEMRSYRDAGFNVVMAGRYMQLDSYGDADQAVRELDLAQKYGLGVFFDTYTKNDRPWGGKADPYEPHSVHHAATLTELRWLYERIGKHPALVGFMIGDDQGEVSPRSRACTDFLFQRRPHLMPWLCGWIDPTNLAANNNPIADPQIYPTLYEWHLPPAELARRYCASYASYARRCRENGVIFWPMFNVQGTLDKQGKDMGGCIPSDSLLRLPAYAGVAYGAEGIWYFCYNSGGLQHLGPHATDAAARRARTPLYPVAQKINRRIGAWGPMLLGRTCTGLFGTAFRTVSEWPFPEDLPPYGLLEDLAEPGQGKLVEAMSSDLIVGVLTRPGSDPLAMVVDCRAAKALNVLPEREVRITFSRAVQRVRIPDVGGTRQRVGHVVTLRLEAGGGQLLELQGRGVGALCQRQAVNRGVGKRKPAARPPLRLSDLATARSVLLRMDVFGSNSGRYSEKWISINGTRVARVPTTDRDEWVLCTISLSPEQVRLLKLENQVVVTNAVGDAWKFRNITLAARRSDGVWVRTEPIPDVYSSPGWTHAEGKPFHADGSAGPIVLRLRE